MKVAERFDLISNNRIPVISSTPNGHAVSPVDANRMDVDSIIESKDEHIQNVATIYTPQQQRRDQPSRSRLTDAERRQLSRARACFYCVREAT